MWQCIGAEQIEGMTFSRFDKNLRETVSHIRFLKVYIQSWEISHEKNLFQMPGTDNECQKTKDCTTTVLPRWWKFEIFTGFFTCDEWYFFVKKTSLSDKNYYIFYFCGSGLFQIQI